MRNTWRRYGTWWNLPLNNSGQKAWRRTKPAVADLCTLADARARNPIAASVAAEAGAWRAISVRLVQQAFPGAGDAAPRVRSGLRAPFARKAREMRLEDGQVVVFPSYVFHEVAPCSGRDVRITVVTDCWFV